jgi:hypothetical protein
LIWSLFLDNVKFRFLSVELREVAEFLRLLIGSPISLLLMYVPLQVTRTQVWQQSFDCSMFFLFLIICMDHGSCFSRNVSLIKQIWRGLLVLNGGMCQAICEIESKSTKVPLSNFGSHCTVGVPVFIYSYVVLIKNTKHKNIRTIIQRNHKQYIFLNKQCCWQHSMILSRCHLIFTNSAFWT